MKSFVVIICTLLVLSVSSAGLGKHARERLAQPGPLNSTNRNAIVNLTVHLVTHTHDDIGWLKTVDQYYYGDQQDIAWAGVRYILTSVVQSLLADPTKKFIYVEIGFFKRWWDEQTPAMQQIVQTLVSNGQLEFINGGWCMNDEADVYYEDSIDNMYIGHQFLLQTFGVIPTVGWHIDPFGHAAAQAALFSQMGFNAFYFSRIDYQDKAVRLMDKSMDMLWTPQTSQGVANSIFTSVNYNHYEAPPDFCFDIRCTDTPIMDDPRLEGYNLDLEALLFVSYFVDMATHYQQPILLHTAGSDFNYQASQINFMNYDKLLNYIANNPEYDFINITYSTPGKYIAELYSLNITFPGKYDDFFPYGDEDSAYWTGYFTSRVALKGYVRKVGQFFQAMKKLVTLSIYNNASDYLINNFNTVDTAMYVLEQAMGILQHHDAVAGTEKQAVAYDYAFILWNATQAVLQNVTYPIISENIQTYLNFSNVTGFTVCNTNVSASQCEILSLLEQNTTLLVTLYNPTQNDRSDSIARIKVNTPNVSVYSETQSFIQSTVICANASDLTDCDLFFNTVYLPEFAFTYYFVVPTASSSASSIDVVGNSPKTFNFSSDPYVIQISSTQSITISADLVQFDLVSCPNGTQSCYNTSFNLSYNYYPSYQSENDQNSGAYIFRPNDTYINQSIPYALPEPATIQIFNTSSILTQFTINYTNTTGNTFITTSFRIYNDWTQGIEIETFVNSININDGQGKELILQIQSNSINNNLTSYTDSMGMEFQKRIVDYRPTWNLSVNQPISQNYYPINAAILINDSTTGEQMSLSNDRAQAGGNILNGEIEIMIHRRLLYDDARGVGEPLNETDWDDNGLRQTMTHILQFSKPGFVSDITRQIQFERDQPIQIFLAPSPLNLSVTATASPVNTRVTPIIPFSGLDDTGYNMVKIMTRSINLTSHIIRLHNMNDSANATSINITTSTFFSPFFGTPDIVEMSLTANQPLATMIQNKYNWNNYTNFTDADVPKDYLSGNYTLLPMQIRTFQVTYPNSSFVQQLGIQASQASQ